MTDDPFTDWARRLARQIAPDEVDLADDMALAYARGGRDRADLLARGAAEPGAFGIEPVVLVLPVMLDVLGVVAGRLVETLRDPILGNAIAASGVIAAWLGGRAGRGAPPAESAPAAGQAPAADSHAGAGADVTALRLIEIRIEITERLADRGIADAQPRAERLLAELLADPDRAADFLAALTRTRGPDAR